MFEMGDTIHCRRAVPDDANAIAHAHINAWKSAYANLIPDPYLEQPNIADSQKRWQERLAQIDPNAFVGELHNKVMSFCTIGPSDDPSAGPHVGHIETIQVHPDARRSGLGQRLLAFSSNMLREHGYTEATLWVLEGNSRARAFYDACGWVLDRGASRCKTMIEIANAELPHFRYRTQL